MRIYEYSSLSHWKTQEFWEEFHDALHFCVNERFGEAIAELLPENTVFHYSTVDSLWREERKFLGRNLQKSYDNFLELEKFFQEQKESISPEDYALWQKNGYQILGCMELLSMWKVDCETEQQELFWQLLRYGEEKSLFSTGSAPSKVEYQEIFQKVFPYLQEEVQQIVLHGVLEFSPQLLACLEGIEKTGIEVVYFVPFEEEFSEFFTPWNTVYQEISHDVMEIEGEEENLLDFFKTVSEPKGKLVDSPLLSERSLFLRVFMPSIYSLWQTEEQILLFQAESVKACIQSAPFPVAERRSLLKTFYRLEVLWKNIQTIPQLIAILEQQFLPQRTKPSKEIPFGLLGMYQESKLSLASLRGFLDFIHCMNVFASCCFKELPPTLQGSLERMKLFPKSSALLLLEENVLLVELQEMLQQELFPEQEEVPELLLLLLESIEDYFVEDLPVMEEEIPDCGAVFSEFMEQCCEMSSIGRLSVLSREQQREFSQYLSLFQKREKNVFQKEEHFFGLGLYPKELLALPYVRMEAMAAYLCPYRYVLSFVVEKSPVFTEEQFYEKFYRNLLIMDIWKNFVGKPLKEVEGFLPDLLEQVEDKYSELFPYLSKAQRFDGRVQAALYLQQSIFQKGKSELVREFAPSHMEMKWRYMEASFQQEKYWKKNILPIFASLKTREQRYSLHQVPKLEEKTMWQTMAIAEAMTEHLNSREHMKNYGCCCGDCPYETTCSIT